MQQVVHAVGDGGFFPVDCLFGLCQQVSRS